MFFFITALLLILGSVVDAKRGDNKVATVATDIECLDTPQCLSLLGNTWCHSGMLCINRLCHRLVDTPCRLQTEICDEATRQCLAKQCTVSLDCDDGLFCNGREKCVNGTCRVDTKAKVPCPHSVCNETTRECGRLNRLGHWRSFTEQEAFAATNTTPVIGESENKLWVGYLIGLVCVLILLAFIFLLMALLRQNDYARRYY